MGNQATPFKSEIISVTPLCKLAKVDPFKIYRRQKGIYQKPISLNDRTKLMNALLRDIEPFVNDLGFDLKVIPLKENSR